MSEKIRPVRLTNDESGETYTLEFSRDAIKFAESRGFDITNFKPLTDSENLFFYAFRMHHPNLARNKVMEMFDGLGGVSNLPEGLMERLVELYSQGMSTLSDGTVIDGKNRKMTVEL